MANKKEIWKAVLGYEGYYEVSDLGRARSVDRIVSNGLGSTRKMKGRLLKPGNDKDGYLLVVFSQNSVCVTNKLHRLVLDTFLNTNPEKQCNHINGIKTDNRLINLEWCTRLENMKHFFINRSINHNKPLYLTKKQVLEIRDQHDRCGVSKLALSKKYGVARCSIRSVVSRKTWQHV